MKNLIFIFLLITINQFVNGKITDYLIIYDVKNLENLNKLFPNLMVINGLKLIEEYALIINNNDNLKEINLHNLKIENGLIRIQNNPKLCSSYFGKMKKEIFKFNNNRKDCKNLINIIKDFKTQCNNNLECTKECDGGYIYDLKSMEKFKNCTKIDGDLIISLYNEDDLNLESKLNENLSLIKIITGYLKIIKSDSLKTLNFFKNLRFIEGKRLDRKNYSLSIIDNANLEELFLINLNEQLNINNGKLLIQLNPKLCFNNINKLKNYTNIKNIDENDVPYYSNGDKAICEINKIKINHLKSSIDSLLIEWTPINQNNFSRLLGYYIFYKEIYNSKGNITSFNSLKEEVKWQLLEHEVEDESNGNLFEIITHLKPSTKYAIYIKANSVFYPFKDQLKQRKTSISDIHYFETKSSKEDKIKNTLNSLILLNKKKLINNI